MLLIPNNFNQAKHSLRDFASSLRLGVK